MAEGGQVKKKKPHIRFLTENSSGDHSADSSSVSFFNSFCKALARKDLGKSRLVSASPGQDGDLNTKANMCRALCSGKASWMSYIGSIFLVYEDDTALYIL